MAIPFAWVRTEKEAEDLIELHCALLKDGTRRIKVQWDQESADGIREAVRVCKKRFGFPVEDQK